MQNTQAMYHVVCPAQAFDCAFGNKSLARRAAYKISIKYACKVYVTKYGFRRMIFDNGNRVK